jgi:hypothetical protein
MKVTEDGVTQMKPFVVATATQRSNTSWWYQLKSTDGLLYEGGKPIPETDLKPRK